MRGFELTEPAENELAWNGSMKQPTDPIKASQPTTIIVWPWHLRQLR